MKNLAMIAFILSVVACCDVSSQTFQWESTYNGLTNQNDYITEIDDDDGGNIYGVGYSTSTFKDWLVIKYDPAGVEQWVRTVNGAGNHDDEALAIVCASPNEIYVTGYVTGVGTGLDMLTIKYDSNGVEQWQHLGGSTIFGERGLDIKVDPSGFIYACKWWSEAAGANHHYLIKYDTDGNVLWERMGDLSMSTVVHTVAVLGNGDVFVGGNEYNQREILVERYDGAGVKLWTSTLPSPLGSDDSYAMGVDANGNAYLAGSSDSSGTRTWIIVKFADNGAVLWSRRYKGTRVGGPENYANDMYVDPAGNIYVTGYIDNDNTFSDCLTMKLNGDGVQSWSSLYDRNNSGIDQGKKCWLSNSGDLYMLGRGGSNSLLVRFDALTGDTILVDVYNNLSFGGETDIIADQFGSIWFSGATYNGFSNDAAIVKYSQTPTFIETGYQIVPGEFSLMQNYPNPFNPTTSITYQLPSSGYVTLTIHNLLGQEIATLVDGTQNAGFQRVEWNAGLVASGIYYYQLMVGTFVETKKMMLIR